MEYIETSAVTKFNVDVALQNIVRRAYYYNRSRLSQADSSDVSTNPNFGGEPIVLDTSDDKIEDPAVEHTFSSNIRKYFKLFKCFK